MPSTRRGRDAVRVTRRVTGGREPPAIW